MSPQVVASASASASAQLAAPCSCRALSHQTVLWHHRLGHPSVQRLRGMHRRVLVSGLPKVLPPLPPSPAPPCLPCVEGRQRATPHSSSFPPTTAPLQTLHMDVWGPARVRGQDRERYFLLVVKDYTRYTTVLPLRTRGEVPDVLIPWIRAVRHQLRERCGTDFPVLRLHSDGGGEFASDFLRDFCRGEGICQTFTLPASPQQNGVAECRIGLIMEWTGKVGDASVFRVWGSRAFVRYTSADKLSARAIPCVFLGLVPDAPGWQFYHPTSRRVLPSQDVTFDESVPFYRLFPPRTAPLPPPPPLFLAPGPPPVDPLPPQGPAPSGVSQVDAVEPVEVAVDSGAATGGGAAGDAEPERAEPGGAEPERGAEPGGAEPGCAESEGAELVGAEPGGAEPGGAEPEGAEPAVAKTGGAESTGLLEELELLELEVLLELDLLEVLLVLELLEVLDPLVPEVLVLEVLELLGLVVLPELEREALVLFLLEVLLELELVMLQELELETLELGVLVLSLLSQLQPASPLPGPSPYSRLTRGLTARREPESRPASPESRPSSPGRCVPRQYPPAVHGTHQMALRPSTAPNRVPLPSPPASSLADGPDPESDSLRATRPTVTRLLATVVTDPSFKSTAASALVGDPDAPDIPTPRSYAEAIEGPYSSQWQTAMDAEMASWKSTGTYVDEAPPPGALSVAYDQLHVAAQRDYELHSLDFITAFLQGSLHEEIWLRRPPGFTGSFPAGTQ
ncbi:unnamed protein product [Closterium sp. NIES-65]|nr:unnamed protein product [Closterium sp. NIES-65]